MIGGLLAPLQRLLCLSVRLLIAVCSLWTRSYFASTAGNVSAQTIARYVAAQRGV